MEAVKVVALPRRTRRAKLTQAVVEALRQGELRHRAAGLLRDQVGARRSAPLHGRPADPGAALSRRDVRAADWNHGRVRRRTS